MDSSLRWLTFLWLGLLCSCATVPVPNRGKLMMRDFGFPLRDMRLPSGLRIVVEEDRRTPTVAVAMVVGVGTSSDPLGKEGLAHFVEHLTFRARPDTRSSVWRLLEKAGAGTINAATGFDSTVYFSAGPREALGKILEVEGNRLVSPMSNVDPQVVLVEREVVRNELRQRSENGQIGVVLSAIQAALFPAGHAYARPLAGTHESLSRLTLEDAQAFARQHYRPDNATLVIAGDVDLKAVDQVIRASLPASLVGSGSRVGIGPRLSAAVPEPPAPTATAMTRLEAGVATPEVYIAWSLPRGFDENSPISEFVRTAAQRELTWAFLEDGDITDIQVFAFPGVQASIFLVRVGLYQGRDPERSADKVLNQVHRLWVDDPRLDANVADVAFAKRRLGAVAGLAVESEGLLYRAVERAEATHFTQDPTTYSRTLRSIARLERARLSEFTYKYLGRERARVVYVSPLSANAPPIAGATGVEPVDAREQADPSGSAERLRAATPVPGVSAYRRLTLENGLEVIIGNRPGLPVVTVGLSLHGGRSVASPRGVMEMATWLSTPGSTFNGKPEGFGGTLSEWGTQDDYRYQLQGGAGNLPNMLAVLAERVPSMRVQEGLIEFVQREYMHIFRARDQQHEVLVERAFLSNLYGLHPYGVPVTTTDIAKIKKSDITEWLAATHQPVNGVLAIVGELDLDETERQVRKWLGSWQGSASASESMTPPPPRPAVSRAPRIVTVQRAGASQVEIRLGCLLPQENQARLDLVSEMLEHRLTRTLRQERGATYGFHGQPYRLRGGAAHLSFQSYVENAQVPTALRAIDTHLTALANGRFEPMEIDRLRWNLARRYSVAFQTSADLVDAILDARNLGESVGSIDAYPAQLATVTAEEVAATLKACADEQVIVVLGDDAVTRTALKEISRRE